MASRFVSVATLFTLLVGDGLAGSVPTEAAVRSHSHESCRRCAVPGFWDSEDAVRRGGQAARIEFDDAELHDGMSTWYRLAYLDGGTRLQVFEHSPIATVGPESDMMRIETFAWRLANEVVDPENRSTASEQLPSWARVRTGNTDGPSAGLIMALAYIDLLTPGALVGDMRVAGTGGIRPDGLAFPVKGIDVKVATATLTRPAVIFVTRPPKSVENVTIVQSQAERIPARATRSGNGSMSSDTSEQAETRPTIQEQLRRRRPRLTSSAGVALRTQRRRDRMRRRPQVRTDPHRHVVAHAHEPRWFGSTPALSCTSVRCPHSGRPCGAQTASLLGGRSMEYRVLGKLEVLRDGHPVDLGPSGSVRCSPCC